MIRFNIKKLIFEHSFRTGKKLTYEDVSKATGISKTTLSKMNRPGYNSSTANIEKLCLFFDCEISDLVSLIREPSNTEPKQQDKNIKKSNMIKELNR